jgi:DNA-binding LytR/AlgR family response regulator
MKNINMESNIIFIDTGSRFERVTESNIFYLTGSATGTCIVTSEGVLLCNLPLQRLESFLQQPLFCRIHESCIVALDKVISFDQFNLYVPGASLPIGNAFFGNFRERLAVLEETDPSNYYINGEGKLEGQ